MTQYLSLNLHILALAYEITENKFLIKELLDEGMLIFNFPRYCQIALQRGCTNFYSHHNMWECLFSYYHVAVNQQFYFCQFYTWKCPLTGIILGDPSSALSHVIMWILFHPSFFPQGFSAALPFTPVITYITLSFDCSHPYIPFFVISFPRTEWPSYYFFIFPPVTRTLLNI